VMNRTQFQHGTSLQALLRKFGTEAVLDGAPGRSLAGRISLSALRFAGALRCRVWRSKLDPVQGLSAPSLGDCRHAVLRHLSPLATWFLAIYLISQAKVGPFSLALRRQLGVSYPTARLMLQKIWRAMMQVESDRRLGGAVRLDDANLGGERAGGKVERGSANRSPSWRPIGCQPRRRHLSYIGAGQASHCLECRCSWLVKKHEVTHYVDYPAQVVSIY